MIGPLMQDTLIRTALPSDKFTFIFTCGTPDAWVYIIKNRVIHCEILPSVTTENVSEYMAVYNATNIRF